MAVGTTPLFTATLLSITLYAGREEVVYAVVAPGLINLWFLSHWTSARRPSAGAVAGALELQFVRRRR